MGEKELHLLEAEVSCSDTDWPSTAPSGQPRGPHDGFDLALSMADSDPLLGS